MDRALGGHQWLSGATFSLSDMAVLPFVERFKVNGMDDAVASKRNLTNWYKKMFARPAVERAYAFTNPADDAC